MDRNIFHKNSQYIEKEEILTIIKKGGYISPTPLQEEVIPSVLQGKNLIIETGKDTGVTGSFLVPLLIKLDAHKDENKVIVFTSSAESVIKIEREFKRFSNRKLNRPTAAFLGYKDNIKKEIKTLKKKPDFIIGTTERIIDHLRRDNITLQHIQTAVITFSDAEENNSFEKDVLFVFSKLPKKFQIIMFLADMKYANPFIEIIKNPHIIKLEKIALAKDYKMIKNRSSSSNFKQSQEIENVSNNKTNFPENEDILNEKIKSIIKNIKEKEDPDELNRYKKIIRNRNELIKDLKNGEIVSVDGYLLTWNLFAEAYDFSLSSIISIPFRKDTLLLDIVKNVNRPTKKLHELFINSSFFAKKVDLRTIEETPFWISGISRYITRSTMICETTNAWIMEHVLG